MSENVTLSDLANGATPVAAPTGMPTKPKLKPYFAGDPLG